MEKLFTMLMNQIKKGQIFVLAGGQYIPESIIISKGLNLLANTAMFCPDIRQWSQIKRSHNTWMNFKTFFQRSKWELHKTVTTARLSDYPAALNFSQDMNTVYIKIKFNNKTYKAHEVISKIILVT